MGGGEGVERPKKGCKPRKEGMETKTQSAHNGANTKIRGGLKSITRGGEKRRRPLGTLRERKKNSGKSVNSANGKDGRVT